MASRMRMLGTLMVLATFMVPTVPIMTGKRYVVGASVTKVHCSVESSLV